MEHLKFAGFEENPFMNTYHFSSGPLLSHGFAAKGINFVLNSILGVCVASLYTNLMAFSIHDILADCIK